MTRDETIWFAGLFEGEGWISFPSRESNTVCIGMKMTDQDVMEKVFNIVGRVGSFRFYERKNPNHKGVWTWSLGNRDEVKRILLAILPWMGTRRSSKTEEALERLERNRGYNQPIDHGTYKGFHAEKRRGLEPCESCILANKKYMQDYYRRNK